MAYKGKSRGEMTEAERQAAQRAGKYQRSARALGKPLIIYPHEFEEAKAHATELHDRGMAYRAMAEQSGGRVIRHVIGDLVSGKRKSLHRDSYDAIMALRFEDSTGDRLGAPQDATGTVRRIQAIRALGFTEKFCADWLDRAPQNIRYNISVYPGTAKRVAEMYDKLQHCKPEDFGVPAREITRALTYARQGGFAPPLCWDDDTIDDPKAIAEWTGACGTPHGRTIHLREAIPMCQPCKTAWTNHCRGKMGHPPLAEGEFDREAYVRLLDSRGVALTELAKRTGLHPDSLSAYRNGRRSPSPGSTSRIAAALGVQTEEITK
jgi:lambda repressor-like predicted transcriptional regulator